MAENKKGFILYADLIHTINKLDDQNAGLLFKHLLAYVNDLNPEAPNLLVEISFEPIKQQLKRDLKHWESIRLKRSEAGIKSAELRKQKQQNSTNPTNVEFVQQSSTNSTVNVNDNVNVNVNDNVTVKVKEKKNKYLNNILLFPIEFEKLVNEFGDETTNEAIKFLSEYKIEKGYTTKSDYLTLKRWVIEAVTKKQNNNLKNLNNATTTANPNDRRSGVERLNKLAGEFLQNNPNLFTLRNPES